MEPEAITVNIDLPLDLADEFKQLAQEENVTESELFQRIILFYSLAKKDKQRLKEMLLEGLASGSRVFGPEEWKALKEKVLASQEN